MRQSIFPSEARAFDTPPSRATLALLRHHLAPLLAWLATICYAAWQLVAEQKLFLHTFLVERVGNPVVPKLPWGYSNVLALKSITLWQQLRRDPGGDGASSRVECRAGATPPSRSSPWPDTPHRPR